MEQGLEPGTLAQGVHLPMAYYTQQNPNLGQPQKKRLHWALNLCLMPTTRGNQRTSIQWIPLQPVDMGPGSSNNASMQSKQK